MQDMSKTRVSSTTTEMCTLAKKIAEISNYMVIPSRIVFPERYIHPNNSLEAKKALLMSMTPMLADAGDDKHDFTSLTYFNAPNIGAYQRVKKR
jgi:hypothetical protein